MTIQNDIASSAQTAEQPEEPVFQARGVTNTYRMGEVDVHALRGVNLDLYAGEFVVILGPSGSGKSTLLNILGGSISRRAARWFIVIAISQRPMTRS